MCVCVREYGSARSVRIPRLRRFNKLGNLRTLLSSRMAEPGIVYDALSEWIRYFSRAEFSGWPFQSCLVRGPSCEPAKFYIGRFIRSFVNFLASCARVNCISSSMVVKVRGKCTSLVSNEKCFGRRTKEERSASYLNWRLNIKTLDMINL